VTAAQLHPTLDLHRSTRMLHVQLHERCGGRQLLRPHLEDLVRASCAQRRVLAVHVEALAGVESSLLADLVWLVRRAHDAGVGLTLFYDGHRPWQALSLDALRRALRAEGSSGTAVSFSEV
jgi:hypothetical protein